MAKSLIDQFCGAIEEWGKKTNRNVTELTFYSMVHSGGVSRIRPEGAVENPYAPEHAHKTVGEKSGHYTVEQVRSDLTWLVESTGIFEDTLVSGLIQSIDTHFTEQVISHSQKEETTRAEAEKMLHISEHIDEYPEFVESLREELARRGSPDRVVDAEFFRNLAGIYLRPLDNPDNNEAERKMHLLLWREITTSILRYDNLNSWLHNHISKLAGF